MHRDRKGHFRAGKKAKVRLMEEGEDTRREGTRCRQRRGQQAWPQHEADGSEPLGRKLFPRLSKTPRPGQSLRGSAGSGWGAPRGRLKGTRVVVEVLPLEPTVTCGVWGRAADPGAQASSASSIFTHLGT